MSETPAERTARIDKLVKKHLDMVAKGKLPDSEFAKQYGGKVASSLGGLGGLLRLADIGLAVIGTPMFYLFILEEAVQAQGFGVFTLVQGKQWREAALQSRRYRQTAALLETHAEYIQGLFTIEGALEKTLDFFKTTENPIIKVDVKEIIPDSVGKIGLSFLFEPFVIFARASISSADAYDSRIASEIGRIQPDYKFALDALKKDFADDSFKLKIAHDERMDELRIEKSQRLDELKMRKKVENDELLSDAKIGVDSESIDKIQTVRRALDDSIEKIRAATDGKIAEIKTARDSSIRQLAATLTDNVQQVQRDLAELLAKIAADVASGVITPAEGESLRLGFETAAAEEIQRLVQEKKEDDARLRRDASSSIASERQKSEDEKDKLRTAAEEEIQKIRKESTEKKQSLGITSREKARRKNAITQKYDELDIKLRVEFDDRERAEKEIVRNATLTLETIHENQKEALRSSFFPVELTDEEKTIYNLDNTSQPQLPPAPTLPPFPQLPPAPSLPPELPPPGTVIIPPPVFPIFPPPEAPKPVFSVLVYVSNPLGRPDAEADINIGGDAQITRHGSFFRRDFDAGNVVKIKIRTSGNTFIAPDLVQYLEFTTVMSENRSFVADIGTKEELHPPVPVEDQPIPADIDELVAPRHTAEIFIFSSRVEFTATPKQKEDAPKMPGRVASLSRFGINTELVQMRITFHGPYTLSAPVKVQFRNFFGDGSPINSASDFELPTQEFYGTPNIGFQYLVLSNGNPDFVREIDRPGIYYTDFVFSGAPEMQGKYRFYYKVVE